MKKEKLSSPHTVKSLIKKTGDFLVRVLASTAIILVVT
jgi:hypothetical protein